MLMFGKYLAIRDPEAAPAFFVDYRERLDPETRYTDRLLPDGTWEANLFQFYQRVVPKMLGGLPTPFMLDGIERRDITPAHEALREAIVNALIHSDYRAGGGGVFERYPDRFQIENPGALLVSMEQYHRGGTSECRNPTLQTMFRFLGGGEQAGSGVARIRYGWASRNWRSPSLELTAHPDRVRLTLPMVSLIPDSALTVLRDLIGAELDTVDANELQALATAVIEGQVSNIRLQELTNLHPVDITRLLSRLCDRGLLRSDNRRRWTSYRLADLDTETHTVAPDTTSPTDTASSGGSKALNGGSETLNGGTDASNGGSEAPEVLIDPAYLQEVAEPVASSKRASTGVVRSAILAMCRFGYLRAEILAEYLKRNRIKLQERYLGPMVQEGLLELRFPETPNHADQAYRTKSSKPA